jgi:hypothetical protein
MEVTIVLGGSTRRPWQFHSPSIFQEIWKALDADQNKKNKSLLGLRLVRKLACLRPNPHFQSKSPVILPEGYYRKLRTGIPFFGVVPH